MVVVLNAKTLDYKTSSFRRSRTNCQFTISCDSRKRLICGSMAKSCPHPNHSELNEKEKRKKNDNEEKEAAEENECEYYS